MTLPVVVPDREPLTEAEARRVGDTANRLARLRYLLREATTPTPKTGTIIVGSGSWGTAAPHINIGSVDLQAALALLIERDELFLASFNVTVEKPIAPIS